MCRQEGALVRRVVVRVEPGRDVELEDTAHLGVAKPTRCDEQPIRPERLEKLLKCCPLCFSDGDRRTARVLDGQEVQLVKPRVDDRRRRSEVLENRLMWPLQHQVPAYEVLDKGRGGWHAGTKHRKVGQSTLQSDALYLVLACRS
ncbi:MAG: hypothetical protein HC828_02190 [Blastochloris sp.]|nr:hypothetical protein [Blastochloris sp.]